MGETRYKLIIFDKDGTIAGGPEDRPPNALHEQYMLPGVRERCQELRERGIRLGVASNQGGVAFGHLTEAEAWELVEDAAKQIGAEDWTMCPHHPEGKIKRYTKACPRRKPAPGMLLDLMQHFDVRRDDTLYVGDREEDREAAQHAGCNFAWAGEFFDR